MAWRTRGTRSFSRWRTTHTAYRRVRPVKDVTEDPRSWLSSFAKRATIASDATETFPLGPRQTKRARDRCSSTTSPAGRCVATSPSSPSSHPRRSSSPRGSRARCVLGTPRKMFLKIVSGKRPQTPTKRHTSRAYLVYRSATRYRSDRYPPHMPAHPGCFHDQRLASRLAFRHANRPVRARLPPVAPNARALGFAGERPRSAQLAHAR